MRLNVTDRNVPLIDPQFVSNPPALPRNTQPWLAARFIQNLHVCPRDSPTPPRPQYLQHRFFSRESAGQMLKPPFAVLETIRLFGLSETSIQEVFPMLFHQLAYPRRFNNIDSMTDDRHSLNLDPPGLKEKH
jgi:hypothetical protein